MKTIKEIRLSNLNALAEDSKYKFLKDFCREAGITPSYLSQLRKGEGGKVIGDEIARRIEENLGLQQGWMDTNHDIREAERPQQGASASITDLRGTTEDMALLLTIQSLPASLKAQVKAIVWNIAMTAAGAANPKNEMPTTPQSATTEQN